jgi:hypothetical protein
MRVRLPIHTELARRRKVELLRDAGPRPVVVTQATGRVGTTDEVAL